MWLIQKNVSHDLFLQIIKEPELFAWATEQIIKDREEQQALIKNIFEALQPWLNPEMYNALEKKKQQQENKLLRITGAKSTKDVEQINAFDSFMKNLGIKKEDLNG